MNDNKNLLFKGLFLGSLAGGLVTLFHKGTRERMKRCAREVTAKTVDFSRMLKENPDELKRQIQDVTWHFKTTITDIKNETQNIMDAFNEFKSNSKNTYESVKETGEELRELGERLKRRTDQGKTEDNPSHDLES